MYQLWPGLTKNKTMILCLSDTLGDKALCITSRSQNLVFKYCDFGV